MTINETLALMKAVRERINDLKSLRTQVAVVERWMVIDKEKTKEPQYDVKAVDKKLVELELWLFKADAAIKQKNATVEVGLVSDVDKLLEPLQ